jgi:hypothetical protein
MLCRYEDFAANPGGTLDEIARFAQIPGPIRKPDSHGALDLEIVHTAAGNPDRLRRTTAVIRPDQRWHREMTLRDRIWATLPAAPLLRGFTYPLWARNAGNDRPDAAT